MTISFGNAITAFAIDVNTFADNDGAYVATVNNGPLIQSRFETFAARSTGQFIGFVSTAPFSSITINAKSGFAYTLDTLVYGDADAVVSVAEPTSLGLLSVVLVAIARLRRRPDVRR